MPTIDRRAGPDAAGSASADPSAIPAPAPKLEERRWFSLRGGERAKQFGLSLKDNARWMKRFLHGGR